ncbi:MAG: hypothetical protein ABF665_11925 [Gluconacetobacter sp.]
MNPYFNLKTRHSEVPRRVYARLDNVESLGGADTVLFSYEAVNADWEGFEGDGLFPLDLGAGVISRRRRGSNADQNDPKFRRILWKHYDRFPFYGVEITAWGQEIRFLLDLGYSWLEMLLEPTDEKDAQIQVYSGLFAKPAAAKFIWPPRRSKHSRALAATFNMSAHPNARRAQIQKVFKGRVGPESLGICDVGQGNANVVLDGNGQPLFYFDLGCGVKGNAPTTPKPLSFCLCGDPPIILSHWDADHWAGAVIDPRALHRTWIAPRQRLSGPHQVALGANILSHGGRLLLVPTPTVPRAPLSISLGSTSVLYLQRATGKDKNGSGLVLTVAQKRLDRAWLLTGDADYAYIHTMPHSSLAGLVVPHHGADMKSATPAPAPPKMKNKPDYCRLAYSFGPGNKNGRTSISHPTTSAVTRHNTVGWDHGNWVKTGNTPGTVLAGGDVRATASNPSPHLNGIIVGWNKPPSPRAICPKCKIPMKLVQT